VKLYNPILALIVGIAIAYWLLSLALKLMLQVGMFVFVVWSVGVVCAWLVLEITRLSPWRNIVRWGAAAQVSTFSLLWVSGFGEVPIGTVPEITIYGLSNKTAQMIALSGLIGFVALIFGLFWVAEEEKLSHAKNKIERDKIKAQKAREITAEEARKLAPAANDHTCIISVSPNTTASMEFTIAIIRLSEIGNNQTTLVVKFRFNRDIQEPIGTMAKDLAAVIAFVGDLPIWLCSSTDLELIRNFADATGKVLSNTVALIDTPLEEFFGMPATLEDAVVFLGIRKGDTTGPLVRAKLGALALDSALSNQINEEDRNTARAALARHREITGKQLSASPVSQATSRLADNLIAKGRAK
jgi:hypothetical protein